MQYPISLPCPQIDSYQVVVDHGVTSVVFEHGNTRQRHNAKQERHFFALSMVFDIIQLAEWQSWANRYGYEWHIMPLESEYSGVIGQTLVNHTIRYTSDISIEPVDLRRFKVSVEAEMDLTTLPLGVVEFTGNWYRAGTPAAPSSTNWILAGTPAAPSANNIIAGSPGVPAA